ncbi:MAG: hypothetical protein ISP35_07835 [Ilumatobacteraceae bacterium]|nr:hypothetical protein [Ilumatobacteraceae bacterium]
MNERMVDGTRSFRQHDANGSNEASFACVSCGSHLTQRWSTPEGVAVLCRECATLHGLGCP